MVPPALAGRRGSRLDGRATTSHPGPRLKSGFLFVPGTQKAPPPFGSGAILSRINAYFFEKGWVADPLAKALPLASSAFTVIL
ncbi:protein of unknown function [Aminobacter niigataensis]|nr:protein of unknown function [Aminobacter niigataensis]